ncbi:DUF3575 domain-containing protein [Prevotella sp. PMUR]|uniref:DUF3575 domain-containing protein n=2 Tax=Xylanibacter muris TaxID=2736290 RepID=A0ABX2APR2_9BACT|nr:DUF3575 domain-containing protein [Xylanibacter muris]
MRMKKLLFVVVVIISSVGAKAQMLALNTDVMLDAFQTPNLGVEIVTGERSTLGLNVFGNHNPWGVDMRITGVQPEYRYFISGRPMHKLFVGLGAIGADYDISWKGKKYDGMLFGGGLTFGYVLNLSQRFNIDFHAGFGLLFYKHSEYYKNDSYKEDFYVGGVPETNADGYMLMPTRIGVSVSYILK